MTPSNPNLRFLWSSLILVTLIIGGVEFGFRRTGGMPAVVPGKTAFEFQWKIQNADAEKVVYVVGDSRVDWGFGDKLVTSLIQDEKGLDVKVVNAGLSAGSARKIAEFLLENHPRKIPGILVINFSSAGFYHFNTSPGSPVPGIKLQDYLDHRIANWAVEKFYTYGRGLKNLFLHFQHYRENGYTLRFGWFSRTHFEEGFFNAKGGNNDGTVNIPDAGYYTAVLNKIGEHSEHYEGQKEKLLQVLREARMLGWEVVLIRLPIGSEMRNIESRLPHDMHPEKIASALQVPFIDYDSDPRTGSLATDQSHLLPDSARAMSRVLAEDIPKFLAAERGPLDPTKREFPPAPSSGQIFLRRATVGDKIGIYDVHSLSVEKLSQNPFYSEAVIDTWMETLSPRTYDKLIFEREMVVAELNGVIIGFGQIDLQKGAIDSFHVATPVLAGQTKTKILAFLEQIALENRIEELQLFTTLDMVNFFSHAGYVRTDILKYIFPNGLQLEYAEMKKNIMK